MKIAKMRFYSIILDIIAFFIFEVNRLYINLTLQTYKDLTFPERKEDSKIFSFAV